MQNGQECWAFGSTQYVREAVNNDEEYIGKKGEGGGRPPSLMVKSTTSMCYFMLTIAW